MTLWADSPQQALRVALQAQPRRSAWHQQLLPALQKEPFTNGSSSSPPCVMAGMICSIDVRDVPVEIRHTVSEKRASLVRTEKPSGERRRQYLCISLASGTRCCGAEKQFTTTHPLWSSVMIGDGHAEVLARRGSVAFFLDGAAELLSHLPSTATAPSSASPLSWGDQEPHCRPRVYHPFLDYAERSDAGEDPFFASSTSHRRPSSPSCGFSWRPSVQLHLLVTYWPCGFMARCCGPTASTGSRLLLRSPFLRLETASSSSSSSTTPPPWTAGDPENTATPPGRHGTSSHASDPLLPPANERLMATGMGMTSLPPHFAPPSSPSTEPEVWLPHRIPSVAAANTADLVVCEHVLAAHRSPADVAAQCQFFSRVKPGKGHPNLHLSCSDKIWRWGLREAREERGTENPEMDAHTNLEADAICQDGPDTRGQEEREERPDRSFLSSAQRPTEAGKGVPKSGTRRPRRGGGGVLGKRRTPLLPFLALSSLHVGVPSSCTAAELTALSTLANATMASVYQSRSWITGDAVASFPRHSCPPSSAFGEGSTPADDVEIPKVDVFRLEDLWTQNDGAHRVGPPTTVSPPPPVFSAASHALVATPAPSCASARVVDSGYSRVSWLSTRAGEKIVGPSPHWAPDEERVKERLSVSSFLPSTLRLKGEGVQARGEETTRGENGRAKRYRDENGVPETEQRKGWIGKSTAEAVDVPLATWINTTHHPGKRQGDAPMEEERKDQRSHRKGPNPADPLPFSEGSIPSASPLSPSGCGWRCCEWEWEAREGERKGSPHSSEDHVREQGGEDRIHRFVSTLPRSSLTLNSKCGLPQGMDEAGLFSRYPELGGVLPARTPSLTRNIVGTSWTCATTERSAVHRDSCSRLFSSVPLLSSLEPSQSRLRCSMAREFPLSRAWMFYRVQELTQYLASVTQACRASFQPIAVGRDEPFAHYIRSGCEEPRACEFNWSKEVVSPLGTESKEKLGQNDVQSSPSIPSTVHQSKDELPVGHTAPLCDSTANSPLCWTIKPRYGDSYRIF